MGRVLPALFPNPMDILSPSLDGFTQMTEKIIGKLSHEIGVQRNFLEGYDDLESALKEDSDYSIRGLNTKLNRLDRYRSLRREVILGIIGKVRSLRVSLEELHQQRDFEMMAEICKSIIADYRRYFPMERLP